MKRATLTLAGALLLIATTARAEVRGGWTATRHKGDAGRLHLQLQHDHSNNGQTMDLAALSGPLTLSTVVPAKLSLTDLGANAPLAAGIQFTFINYTGGWNGGLFSVNGNVIPDDAIFGFGANVYQLDYNAAGPRSTPAPRAARAPFPAPAR